MSAFIIRVVIGVSLISMIAGCATSTYDEGIRDHAGLKLANGGLISESAYDDYSPIIVRLSNNYLALVFGSTRTCSLSCSNHNIFVSSSVAAYTDNGILPAFNPPQVMLSNASPIDSASRLRLAVTVSGTMITIYGQSPGGQISTNGPINPVSAVPINSGMFSQIAEYNCSSNNLLGMDASGLMIAANLAGTQVFRFNPNTVGGGGCGSVSNTKLATGTHISLVRQISTGIADSFIVSDTAGKISAQTATSDGPQLAVLKNGVQASNLVSTGVSVMQGTSEEGDLITFSAAPSVGGLSDLYVLLSPKPAALWKQYVAAGAQPSP